MAQTNDYFTKPSGKEEKVVSVDLWKTGMHGKKIGVNQQEIFMAKSNQFTRDMNLVGEIKEKDDKENGSIGVRDSIVEERLVLKAFSGSMTWLGTFEEATTLEIMNKLANKKSFPVFKVILPRYDFIVELRKVMGGFLKTGKYSFFLNFDEEFNEFFTITETRFSRGDDWLVKNFKKEVVAKIDGKMFDVGGQWDVKVYSPNLAKDKEFLTVLLLFAGFRKYEKDVTKRIGKIYNDYKKKKFKPDTDELSLYKNPRSKR